ncbi:hypothetical protein WH50_04230 [Pokkaliibacter plantistimulans]|uniref:KOW domain-containing protein n=1 Tax=Pokkaliibacter plantistimulans TaxID=1635171 RepID=A0ABX5M456_9GAMM|nr:hypothetical protein [Pokkaliibacter plantistimulans]PXF32498.1 hypothetical protein WH50_04230 [Pokkaliibacter plantistimulans]
MAIEIDIDELTEEELVSLNHRIVERLKFIESFHNHKEMMQFSPGEQVSFQPPGRDRQIGILTKFNKKTVTVITESGQKWNVSPQLISKVKTVKPNKNKSGKVVALHGSNKNR